MVEINNEYIFTWKVIDGMEDEEDKAILLKNSGMNCKALGFEGTNEFGRIVLLECCNGEIFTAYESELDELKPSDIRCFGCE